MARPHRATHAAAGLPTDRRRGRHRDLRAAVGDVAGLCLGILALGITFGLLVAHTGLAWWWAPAFSGLIFAGSLEFLLVALIGASTGLAEIALATVLVNGRHLFYGLSFPLHRVSGRLRRIYSIFALSDEAYALTTTRPADDLSSTRILVMQALMHLSWVGGGVLGGLAGSGLPIRLPALDFVFVALFVVLAVEAGRTGHSITDPLLAAGCALGARVVAPGQMLLVAMGMYCGLLLLGRVQTARGRHA